MSCNVRSISQLILNSLGGFESHRIGANNNSPQSAKLQVRSQDLPRLQVAMNHGLMSPTMDHGMPWVSHQEPLPEEDKEEQQKAQEGISVVISGIKSFQNAHSEILQFRNLQALEISCKGLNHQKGITVLWLEILE